ncbi:MAG: ATP-binding protein [Sandaracinus sp.]
MSAPRASGRAGRGFVGRAAEIETFLGLGSRGHVLWIHGPGGVGKTTLARELGRRCQTPSLFVRIDRNLDQPEQILRHVEREVGASVAGLGPLLDGERALFVDDLDKAPSLDAWIADEILRAPPRAGLLVVSSRTAPSRDWLEPSLRERLVTVPLTNFAASDAEAYLAVREVPVDRREALVAATHGHPLALALAAEAPEAVLLDPDKPRPDVWRVLLDGLVDRSMTAAQREALECIAVVPALTESLLRHLRPELDARQAFDWLEARPYVRAAREGLVLHDLVRDVMTLDHGFRDPERLSGLATRAMEYYATDLELGRGDMLARAHALAWLFAHLPAVRRTFEKAAHELYVDGMRSADRDAIAALIARVDGPETQRIWEASLAHDPRETFVARDAARQMRGMWLEQRLSVEGASDALAAHDPAVRIALEAARALELTPGQVGSMQRLQLDVEAERGIGATIHLRVAHDARVLLTTPELAVRWIVAPAAFSWAKVWESRGYVRLATPFTLDAKEYAVWQLDLRGTRAADYVRAAFRGSGAVPLTGSRPPPVAIDLASLRRALESAADPHTFARSELAAHPSFRASDPDAGVARFRERIRRELETLGQTSRGAKWRRAVEATYLELPQRSQEAVAEALDLPFRTYRDHLTAGLRELLARLV